TRMTLMRQSFFETLPLAIVGAALGILAADSLLKLLLPLLPPGLPRVEEIAIHMPVMLCTIVLSILAALAISIAPASQVSASLRRGPAGHARTHSLLVGAEIACTVVLLVTEGLLMRSFVSVRATDPGFDPS